MLLCGCESFYKLFEDDSNAQSGIYSVVYSANSSDEDIAAIPDVPLLAGDLRNQMKTYDLTYEVTLAFDTETDNEASLSLYYYHNRNDEMADDYCCIGNVYMGTYVMTEDTITFSFEPEQGYNVAYYEVGPDYADLEEFQQFSYAEDKGNGVWAYEYAPYEVEDEAVILQDIVKDIPECLEITVKGSRIVTWKAVDKVDKVDDNDL